MSRGHICRGKRCIQQSRFQCTKFNKRQNISSRNVERPVLKKEYENKSLANQLHLFGQLMAFKLKDDDIIKHFGTFDNIVNKLKSADVKASADEQCLSFILLRLMNDKYYYELKIEKIKNNFRNHRLNLTESTQLLQNLTTRRSCSCKTMTNHSAKDENMEGNPKELITDDTSQVNDTSSIHTLIEEEVIEATAVDDTESSVALQHIAHGARNLVTYTRNVKTSSNARIRKETTGEIRKIFNL